MGSDGDSGVVQVHDQVPSSLGDPARSGVGGGAEDADAASGVLDDREDAGGAEISVRAGQAVGSVSSDDLTWLIAELRTAWGRLDKFRDRIDDSGSLADNGYLSSAFGYGRWSRKPQALSPCPEPASACPGAQAVR